MDFSQNMILPKGFVINSDDIYKEVASYPVVPPEKIKEYWSVYTTTFRRLIDPTANRLENFWWHVWGSDRKNLSGKTLARIFEEISTGPTIAPLRGPPNRWEPPVFGDQPPPWEKNKKSAEPSTVSDSAQSTRSATEACVSVAKPPPPTPILKKTRTDSKTGPRPTARFAFPDDDDSRDSGEASSESASAGATEMQRSSSGTKYERRKGPVHKKQFHTSTAVKPAKRRPGLARRISSQTSASSETTVKDEGSVVSAKEQGQPDAIPNTGGIDTKPHVRTSASAAPEKPLLSSKAAGKRPAARPGLERRTSQEAPRGAASGKRIAKVPHTRSLEDVREQKPPPQKSPQETCGGGAPNGSTGEKVKARPPLPRSQTHADPPSRAKVASSRTPRHTLAAEPTASTTTVAAQGMMTDFDDGRLPPPMVTVLEAVDDELPRDTAAASSPLDAKFVPTQPSLAPAPPLGRSRSQLTLLLEREKERLGDRGPRG